ncbi:retrovirus-related pol polyprotein from transposon TNT 1-94 [Tanacetum coccineum]
MAKGAIKVEAQWTPDERRVVLQDQRLKCIIVSCLPDDIMKSVISCETAKDTWFTALNDFQENSDDEIDERSNEEYLRDSDIEFHKRALFGNSKCFKCGNKSHFAKDCFSTTSEPSYKSLVTGYSLVSKDFQQRFTLKLIQSTQFTISQAN